MIARIIRALRGSTITDAARVMGQRGAQTRQDRHVSWLAKRDARTADLARCVAARRAGL